MAVRRRRPELRADNASPRGLRDGTPVLVPVLAAVLACYAVLLAVAAASPQRMPQNVHLAAWLRQHHLRSGLAPYWQASSVTVDSGGSITMLPSTLTASTTAWPPIRGRPTSS